MKKTMRNCVNTSNNQHIINFCLITQTAADADVDADADTFTDTDADTVAVADADADSKTEANFEADNDEVAHN